MPPKKGGKKGKKIDEDDEYWEKKAAALELKSPGAESEEDAPSKGSAKGVVNTFGMLDDGDSDEGGGLMVGLSILSLSRRIS